MNRLLKIAGIFIAFLALVGLSVFLYITFKGIPSYEVEKVEFTLKSTPQSIERGKKLALMLCANCHKNSETGQLTGKTMTDAPPEFGVVNSPNITNDNTFGIGAWTDSELVYLLRTGIKRDGQYAPPYMAKLPALADEDMNAIISFLRSDDELVVANPTPDQPCEPSFLTKFLCAVAFKPLPLLTKEIELPDTNNKVLLGEYLAHNLECFSCHSADFKSNNYLDPKLSEGFFGGGNKPLNLKGQVMVSSNLTPDSETGIGSWSEEQFIKALKYGLKEGEEALQYPMMPYTQLTDSEASAIFAYLKTIPPISNEVERIIYE